MNVTIINDCKDDNAKGRQVAKASLFFGGTANFVGVSNELEAAGNIIDILDSNGEHDGVILANVAPRNGKAKRYLNGTPFGYFWYKKTLVVSSVDGLTLSLVKKLDATDAIYFLDIPKTLDVMISKKYVATTVKNKIAKTQFRSLEYLPLVASYLVKYKDIEAKKMGIAEVPDAPNAVWWVDNFGNCKTTLLDAKQYKGKLPYYSRLKDLPYKKTAIITGSSGLGEKRFLEIVVQGGNAAKTFSLTSGENSKF